MQQELNCIALLVRNVSATVSAVHHDPQMFCLLSLQLCRKFHTSLAWLLSNAQKKLTGSGRLVLTLSFLIVCYHLKSCCAFILSVCVPVLQLGTQLCSARVPLTEWGISSCSPTRQVSLDANNIYNNNIYIPSYHEHEPLVLSRGVFPSVCAVIWRSSVERI